VTDQTPRCTATDHGGCTPALCPDAAVTVLGLTRADAAPYDAGDAPTTTRPLPVRDEAHHLRQRIAVLDAQLADERRVTRLLRGTISRYVGDLTDAGAVVQAARDAVAVLDRALAVYDTAPAAPASERRECTALCRDIEADRDRLSADLARTAATLTREEQAHAEVEEDLHRTHRLLDQTRAALRVALHHLADRPSLADDAAHAQRENELAGCRIALQDATEAVEAAALGSPAGRAQGEVTVEYGVRIQWNDGRTEDQPRGSFLDAERTAATWTATAQVIRRTVTTGPWQPAGLSADPATAES
jgi:Rad3-related DNA helicase